MARQKQPKSLDVGLDLLGEVFRPRTRIIRKERMKSLERPNVPLLIGGVPYVPQQQQTPTTTPLPQQIFHIPQQALTSSMIHMPHTEQILARGPQNLTQADLDQLRQFDKHFKQNVKDITQGHTSTQQGSMTNASRTTITIIKHICANCGKLRSSSYHNTHPIKPGDEPIPSFCRKCQKEASSTSESDSSDERTKRKRATGKQKRVKSSCSFGSHRKH